MTQGKPNAAETSVRSDVRDDRFWAKAAWPNAAGCRLWTGHRDRQGYGVVMREAVSPSPMLAHRYAFLLTHGSIPAGAVIRHSCDNPPCVEPTHLLTGTQQDNINDRQARGRHRPGRLLGEDHPAHRLTDHDVLLMRTAYEKGVATKVIASVFGVSSHAAYLAISGKNWTHVDGAVQMRGRGRPKKAA